MTTVRDLVSVIHARMLKGYDSPMSAAEDLVEATALLANVQAEILEAEVAFNAFHLACSDTVKTAAKAKLIAASSPEWVRLKKAQNTGEWLMEAIRTLKHYGNTQREAMRMGG